ncbi:hypothetical protein CBR_g23007 [Chara braunii]|uniref:Uncharacterized protein n=1 Tax=Chara braunii TaxID=69332 RepID=A0A388L3B1_CHABU|nr:hypothetical protein CBR_g23007 [Chara braunii]|eukprot:GBG76791.1 hypothetical protein CBR_g23007 [Chara braunii]
MDRFFGAGTYYGDPGVPHSDPKDYWSACVGALGYVGLLLVEPIPMLHNDLFNPFDFILCHENHKMKKAVRKKKPYKPTFNKLKPEAREFIHDLQDLVS